jgi:hypothetical protein
MMAYEQYKLIFQIYRDWETQELSTSRLGTWRGHFLVIQKPFHCIFTGQRNELVFWRFSNKNIYYIHEESNIIL